MQNDMGTGFHRLVMLCWGLGLKPKSRSKANSAETILKTGMIRAEERRALVGKSVRKNRRLKLLKVHTLAAVRVI